MHAINKCLSYHFNLHETIYEAAIGPNQFKPGRKLRGRPCRTSTETEGGWSNVDRGRGKGPCGRQASTFFIIPVCFVESLYG